MFYHRLIKLAIFIIYWLGLAPWLVLILRREGLLHTSNLSDLLLKYITVFFILILIYFIVHQVFEYYYTRHTIKKIVRKVTIRHQLARLERGEIDLIAAQRLSTFTKVKSPKRLQKKKSKSRAGKVNKLSKKWSLKKSFTKVKLSQEKDLESIKELERHNIENISVAAKPGLMTEPFHKNVVEVVKKNADGL